MLDLIGNTPLYQTQNIDVGQNTLLLKMEHLNPGGSIKDRIAAAMIHNAEQQGKLKPGGTIVEATVGNTGLALAHIAAMRGYKTIIVMPDKVSEEKRRHLRACGAELIITPTGFAKGHPEHYQEVAARLVADNSDYFFVNQFNNMANPQAHEETTAPEIWAQSNQQLDAIVLGAGTGGHLTGIGRFFKRVAPEVAIILADPAGSVLAAAHQGKVQESSP